MKRIVLIFIFSLFLFSCSKENDIVEDIIKQDFYINVKKVSDFGNELSLGKTGKLSSSQDIKLLSKVSGKVGKIYVKEGDYIEKGTIIAKLDDEIDNYGLILEKAKNSINKINISYESTKNKLNKNISDININLSNLKIDEYNSKSSLELEKIDNSIKKIIIDYENLKTTNSVTINNFKNNIGKEVLSLSILIDDIIEFSDKILGVTEKYKNESYKLQNFIGSKDFSQKKSTELYLNDLIKIKNNDLVNINFNLDGTSDFNKNILDITNIYAKIHLLLTNLDLTLDNSIINYSYLSESKISLYKSNINTFWSSYNSSNGGFIALKNNINSFLDTYSSKENSVLKQIELLEVDKKIYVKGLDIKLELDEDTLEEAILNKDLTLKNLDTLIIDAQISYKQALNNFGKLTIKSPISGIVGKILIDVGQDIGINNELFNVINNQSKEVVISFSKDELKFINIGDYAYVKYDNIFFTGSIYSISAVADSNLNYLSRISFPEGVSFIGDIVNVNIPYSISNLILPINIVKINNSGIGTINLLVNGIIEQKDVKLGKIYNNKIEILTDLNLNLDIIINYVDNYDSNKFNLKVKK